MTATWFDRRTVGLVIALLLGIGVATAPAGPASGSDVAQTHAHSA
jgi:hypothetical protein